jgi:putative phosphoesterase
VRPEAIEALRGSDVILHAGDIGGNHVLQELGEIAPVIPVRGNVDGGWARLLPERRRLDLGGVSVLILHDRGLLGLDRAEEGLGVVVFGHSHQPLAEKKKGVLWFNPGSAGPRRFRLPVSVGCLVIEDGRVRHHLLTSDAAHRQTVNIARSTLPAPQGAMGHVAQDRELPYSRWSGRV